LRGTGKRYPSFRLLLHAKATDLIADGDHICGCRVASRDGSFEVRADLVVGADGRQSTLRAKAALSVFELGAPMDVFWMRLSRRNDDPGEALGRIDAGRMMVMLDRGDYWQCAFLIPKGSAETVRRQGLHAFTAQIRELAPWLADRVGELKSWDDIKLLTVTVDRLAPWYRPGLLCIGDAAHAMSPIGGVGSDLAVQDAVADRPWHPTGTYANGRDLAALIRAFGYCASPGHRAGA
jgi:2-polyprenyl-6-methoxyphenol hydroxylase-like FAD-dependent oxidoreductase